MTEQQVRRGQEGGRWVNVRPSSEDVAKWFSGAVKVDEGLEIADYVSGLTLISSTEKVKEAVGFRENNTPILQEMEHSIFVPYVKVETRVKYFHDLLAKHADEWVGFIDAVLPEEPNPSLPPGFFRMVVKQTGDKGEAVYVCCAMKVTVYKRAGFSEEKVLVDSRNGLYEMHRKGEVVIAGAAGTKMVPLLNRAGYSDPNAVMKAETGAIGRALGFAGMLVAPGSGVATAEDMEEALRMESAPQAVASAELPGSDAPPALQSATPEQLRPRVVTLIGELETEFPERHKAFLDWCKERKFAKVSELNEAALKGMIRKVETELDEGRKAAASVPEEPAPETPKAGE